MNTSMRILLFTILFAIIGNTDLIAAKPFVITKQNKKQVYDQISCNSRGVLTLKKGQITMKMNPRDYKYARVPMPKSIKKAAIALKDKKYSEAAAMFGKLYPQYKYVGWDVFCALAGAQAFEANGKKTEAIKRLTLLKKIPTDPANVAYYMRAQKLLAALYVDTSDYSKALAVLNILAQSKNDNIAAFSNNLEGDILLKQGKTKDAKLMYMKTALLFDKTNRQERPEALLKIIEMLKKEKNNKALEFEKMLKTDYPGSKYIKSL